MWVVSSDSEDEENVAVEISGSSESSADEDVQEIPKDGEDISKSQEKEGAMATSLSSEPPKPRRKRFIPNYEVEGVYTVILSEETQLQIEMLVGVQITAQQPWKMTEKSKIMEHLETLRESSEFFPLEAELKAYMDDEILMGYNADETKDVAEFYICLTPQSRDHCKQQSDRFMKRIQKKLDKSVFKTPKPWKCLDSDKEIIQLQPINTRTLLELEIKSVFPTAYDPPKFQVRDANMSRDGYIELLPYRQKFTTTYKKRVDVACQAAPSTVVNYGQTSLKYPKNMWTQTVTDSIGTFTENTQGDPQGGGDAKPSAKDDENKEQGIGSDDESEEEKEEPDEVALEPFRAAMKRMRRPSYIKLINKFTSTNEKCFSSILELNTVMDMYCNDYSKLAQEKQVDVYSTMTFSEYVCFTDVRAKDKFVSCAAFHPMWSGIVALSYADGSPNVMKFLGPQPDPIKRAVYGLNPVLIWSHIDSLIPRLYLESPREVKIMSFCPFNENILVAGCINGQIIIWDLTNKLEHVETIEVLTETKEKHRIAMNAHMNWMKSLEDRSTVEATVASNLMTSHNSRVTAIQWLSPNFRVTSTGKKEYMAEDEEKSIIFLTGSEEGTILIWNLSTQNVTSTEAKKIKKSKRVLEKPAGLLTDVSPLKILDRNLKPIFRIYLGAAGQPLTLPLQGFDIDGPKLNYKFNPAVTGKGRKYYTCEIVEQSEKDIPKIVYCGSSHGELMRMSWDGHQFNTGEVVCSEYCSIHYSCHLHDGIITSVSKNPFLSYLCVTVGGKIFALWSDNFKGKPIVWKKRPFILTDAVWSLYKPSVLFITTSEGTLETWDFLLKSHQPLTIQTLSGTPLTGISLHSIPLVQNMIGVSDVNGSFKMFLNPPIFMLENPVYVQRFDSILQRDLRVKLEFEAWQKQWMVANPYVLEERKLKEAALIEEKEEEKKRLKEEEEKRLEDEEEAKRLARLRVIGPEERWRMIVNKLIEKTIAMKKRINLTELMEQEKPLRELELQRLEKEKRMLDIMKHQKTIFNDTVAILFPEAIQKPKKVKKSFLSDDITTLKKKFLSDYEEVKKSAIEFVENNTYNVEFSWQNFVAEGKERREALTAHEAVIKLHKNRLDLSSFESLSKINIDTFDNIMSKTEAEAVAEVEPETELPTEVSEAPATDDDESM